MGRVFSHPSIFLDGTEDWSVDNPKVHPDRFASVKCELNDGLSNSFHIFFNSIESMERMRDFLNGALKHRTPEPFFCSTPKKCTGLSRCPRERVCND